jgi:CRISPR-associated protein Cmr3
MRYLVTLKPLTPFLFGGKNTFGKLGDKEEGSYIVESKQFPQQTTLLGMIQKQAMIHHGLLTRKRRGEWVDKENIAKAQELVGKEKFNLKSAQEQSFGGIGSISPVFLTRNGNRYIKKVDIDTFRYDPEKKWLQNYGAKQEDALRDSFFCIDTKERLSSREIFQEIEQVGNRKIATKSTRYDEVQTKKEQKQKADNAFFKKKSYMLKDNFCFAFYLKCDEDLLPENSIVSLGADGGKFIMQLTPDDTPLEDSTTSDHLVLLSDSYLPDLSPKDCSFMVTSEVEFVHFYKPKGQKNPVKTDPVYLYEKGSVFFNPSQELIDKLNQPNLQKIGMNHYSHKGAQS